MKRDVTGKFVPNWDSEAKQRVSITLTATAWHLLDEEAQQRGISRSEVIEQVARGFRSTASTNEQSNEQSFVSQSGTLEELDEVEKTTCAEHASESD